MSSDMTNRRVILICGSFLPDIGGRETALYDLLSALLDKKLKVVLLTFQPHQSDTRLGTLSHPAQGETIVRLPLFLRRELFPRSKWNPLGVMFHQPLILLALLASLIRWSRETVVVHVLGLASLPLVPFICKLFKVKCVLSIHHQFEPEPRLFPTYRLLLKGPDVILTLSLKEMQQLGKIGVLPPVKPFGHWVDLNLFKPVEGGVLRKQNDLEGKLIVLFVGRLIEEKGIDIVLELASLFRFNDNISFLVVGKGPLLNLVERRATSLSTLKCVGPVSARDLPKWYSIADVLMVPSRGEEGYGRVIMEALSCGTPVIASNRGGIPEAMSTDVGFLVEPTLQEFKRCIDAVLASPSLLASLQRNCRPYAERAFSKEKVNTFTDEYFEASRLSGFQR